MGWDEISPDGISKFLQDFINREKTIPPKVYGRFGIKVQTRFPLQGNQRAGEHQSFINYAFSRVTRSGFIRSAFLPFSS